MCNGNCADLPTAPIKTSIPAIVKRFILIESSLMPNTKSLILNEPILKNNIIIPINIPMSPTLLVKKALFAAKGGFSFSNQKPINKKELKPTSSQKTYIIISESAKTIPFIEKVKIPKNA